MANPAVLALVGSDSLLGREIRDIVATQDPGFQLRLIAADTDAVGTLTRQGDEPALVESLTEESVAGVRGVFVTGTREFSIRALDLAGETPVIDLTYAAEDRPDARLRAPQVEGEAGPGEGAGELHVVAHPAAIALALFLRRLHANDPIRRAVIDVFAPASEFGTAGVDELQQQTVSLLSFKSMPKAVFDAQSSFTLLARYGEDAPVKLEDLELLIDRHLATLLALEGEGEGAPMPSLRMIHAPVFHGYSFSAWVEFEVNPGAAALEDSLPTNLIEVRGADFEPPNNVGQASMDGISVGAITPDRNDAEACWFWIVTDNLRLQAANAVEVARGLL